MAPRRQALLPRNSVQVSPLITIRGTQFSGYILAVWAPKAGPHFTKVTASRSAPEFADYLLDRRPLSEADSIHVGDGQPGFTYPQGDGETLWRESGIVRSGAVRYRRRADVLTPYLGAPGGPDLLLVGGSALL